MEENKEVAHKKNMEHHKNINKVKGAFVQACENIVRPHHRTAQEKVVASGSDCKHAGLEIYCVSSIGYKKKH